MKNSTDDKPTLFGELNTIREELQKHQQMFRRYVITDIIGIFILVFLVFFLHH